MKWGAILLAIAGFALLGTTAAGRTRPALTLSVSGNKLVNGSGRAVQLRGVNRSSFEYACAQGWGFYEGPVDAAAIAAMKSWKINAVRIPLNEACWLGLPGISPTYGGSAYRQRVAGFVKRLHAAGLYVIVDLHWSSPGSGETGQQPMPDADHSPAFWKSVARRFRHDRAIVFDLYNEPHGVSWQCWRNGCSQWAGMQTLVKAVRSTGANQPLMLGGLEWSNDLSQWLRWKPKARGLVASFHLYNFNACSSTTCWKQTIGKVARSVPVVTGELGENDCAHGFVDKYMRWADTRRISYLGWTWNVWGCGAGPALIKDYKGTPTPFGAGLRAHLRARNS